MTAIEVQPWQQRVLDEKKELDERHAKLDAFLASGAFLQLPEPERRRLRRQWRCMNEYSGILAERIDAWTPEPSE